MSLLPRLSDSQRQPPYARQTSDVDLLSTASTEDTLYSSPARSSVTVNRVKSGDLEAHVSPHGWPVAPRPLSRTALSRLSLGLFDGSLALLPLLFIAMGATTANLDGRPLSHWGDMVQRATLIGPTVFPIMFAALVGSTLKTFARYKAENGAKLGDLEQLMGSHTLFSTVETHYYLRTFGPLGICLILLWALSPLGGQSALRLLSTTQRPNISSANLRYLSTNQTTYFGGNVEQNSTGYTIGGIYTAAILAPSSIRQSSMDNWGNVKIPVYEKLANRPASGNPWLPVTQDAVYSSLLGLPVVGRPDSDSIHFTIESTYFNIDCQSLGYVNSISINSTIKNIQVHNASELLSSGVPPESFFLDTTTPFAKNKYSTTSASYPQNLLFGSRAEGGGDLGLSLANCTVTSTRVESHVQCQHSRCSVDRMRRSETDRRAATTTPFDDFTVSDKMFRAFTTATGDSAGFEFPTATEQSINDPSAPYTMGPVALYKLPKDVFTERFALLFNTYYQAGLAPKYQTGDLPTNMSVYDLDYDPDGKYSSPFQSNTTSATVTNYQIVYVSNRAWLAIMMICSLILQFCAIAGLVLKHRLKGPDILGFVSSMTRDNQYTPLHPGGSTLDGLERARLLKNVPVRLEDVSWSDDIGHIALTFTDGEADSASRLKKNRPYL